MPETASPKRAIIAIAAIAIAIVAWVVVLKPGGGVDGQYFYDLGTNSLYVESVKAVPPVTRPSGAEGVLAVVMACTSCDDQADRFIGYLEKNTDAYNQLITSGEAPTSDQLENKSLIRAVDGETWLPSASAQAMAITTAATKTCGTTAPTFCTP